MKLYGYWRSSATWRVRIALGLKALPYEYEAVHLLKEGGQQFTDEHRQRNAMKQVPVLEVLDAKGEPQLLGQSLAILEYLEEVYPQPALLPTDPVLRARVRQLAEIVNSGIQPFQNLSVGRYLSDTLGADVKAWTRHFVGQGLQAFDATARQCAGTFCVGDTPTLADACLVPQLYAARRFDVPVDEYPLLLRIEEACYQLKAFQDAHADRQSDAV
jgi:maleylpyruvate isomerase